MDENKARRKEAERTLKRIRGTLNHLEDGSAWEDPLAQNKEYQRMKSLIQHGYTRNSAGPAKRLLLLIRYPVFLLFLVLSMVVIFDWF